MFIYINPSKPGICFAMNADIAAQNICAHVMAVFGVDAEVRWGSNNDVRYGFHYCYPIVSVKS